MIKGIIQHPYFIPALRFNRCFQIAGTYQYHGYDHRQRQEHYHEHLDIFRGAGNGCFWYDAHDFPVRLVQGLVDHQLSFVLQHMGDAVFRYFT